MIKKILVLGSEGQIGSDLSDYLEQKKYYVDKVDLVYGKKYDLRKISSFVQSKIKRSDFIFFLAFDVGGSRYLKKFENSFIFLDNNCKIMTNVFNKIKKEKKNFIFASSQMSNMTFSNYGMLKNLGEKFTSSLKGISVRFWNVYGFEKNTNKSHVITDFVKMAVKEKKIKMLTDGSEKRDFLYSRDCSRALYLIMKNYNKLKKKKIIDLAYGKQFRIYNIAVKIKNILFKKFGYLISIKKSKQKDTVQKQIFNKPKNNFLHFWKPAYDINRGIEKIIEHYKN